MPRKQKRQYGLRNILKAEIHKRDLLWKHLALLAKPISLIKKSYKIAELYNKSNYLNRLRQIEKEYDITDNPLLAWEAFLLCANNNRPIPPWILSYLKNTAENLFSLTPGPRMGGKVASAMGLLTQGKGTAFSQLRDARLRLKAVDLVIALKLENPGRRLEDIFSDVAVKFSETGKELSNQTVERWFSELKDTLG